MASRVCRPLALSVSTGMGLLSEDAVAGAQQRARQAVADDALRHFCRGDRSPQVDIDVDSAVPQQIDEIFDGDVAARTWRKGAAAEPADRCVKSGDTGAHGRVGAGQTGSAGVVEVRAEWDVADHLAHTRDQIADA